MRKTLTAFIAGALTVTVVNVFSQGETTPQTTPKKNEGFFKILLGEQQQELLGLGGKVEQADRVDLGAEYASIGNDLAAQKELLGFSLTSFYGSKGSAKSAAQISQIADEARVRMDAIQIAQNRRIIALLEEIRTKK